MPVKNRDGYLRQTFERAFIKEVVAKNEEFVRDSPKAVNVLNVVWDDVYEVSKSYDTADNYAEGIHAAVFGGVLFFPPQP